MNSDRELLEWAAKAAGIGLDGQEDYQGGLYLSDHLTVWNPLFDDGDAMRLMVKLGLYIEGKFTVHQSVREYCELGELAAVRRAIVRAAAEIGKAKP